MKKVACAILIIGITFSTPLRSEKRDYKKLAILSAISITITSVLIGYCIWHKKKEPSNDSYCQQCQNRGCALRELHCGHLLCSACMDQIGIDCIKGLGAGFDKIFHCPICQEEIQTSEIYSLISEDLQDLITILYFV